MPKFVSLFLLLLLPFCALSQVPTLPADQEKKRAELQKQLGQAVDVLALGLEIYQVANSPDIESALENFVAKTGIKLYPSLLLKTKSEPANKFFAEFAQLRYSSFQEPYLILELTFSDSSAAFKVSPSPSLEKQRKKIEELCNLHIGGFVSGKNKLSLLGNVPKLSLSLRDLADAFAESGIVDKLKALSANLKDTFLQVIKSKRDSLKMDSLGKVKRYASANLAYVKAYTAFNGMSIEEDTATEEVGEAEEEMEYELVEVTNTADPDGLRLSALHLESEKARLDLEALLRTTLFLVDLFSKEETFQTFVSSFESDYGDFLKGLAEDVLTDKGKEAVTKRTNEYLKKKIEDVALKDL